jgi:hypothetical protein
MELLEGLLNSEQVGEWLQAFFSVEMAKLAFAFVLAERLHSRAMRRTMSEQFGLLRGTIDHVADVMAKRMDGLEDRIESLEIKK